MKTTIFSRYLPQPPVTVSDRWLIIGLSTLAHYILFYTVPYHLCLSNEDTALKNSKIKSDNNKYNKRVAVIRNYMISTIHSMMAIVYVGLFYMNYTVDLKSIPRTYDNGVIGTGDEYIPYMISWSIGYFVYDLLCMIQYNKQLYNIGSVIHHVLMIVSFSGMQIYCWEMIITPNSNTYQYYIFDIYRW